MEWIVTVQCRDGSQTFTPRTVARISRRSDRCNPEEVGLALEDSKAILSELQRNVVLDQIEGEMQRHSKCSVCGARTGGFGL